MAEFIEALKEVGKKNEFKESFPKEIENKEKKDRLVGIDGWLLIYTLYFIPGTISFIIILPALFNLFNSEDIYFKIIILFLLPLSLLKILSLLLIFGKNKKAPLINKFTLIYSSLFIIILSIFTPFRSVLEYSPIRIFVSVIINLLWFTYWEISIRVTRTFTRTYQLEVEK